MSLILRGAVAAVGLLAAAAPAASAAVRPTIAAAPNPTTSGDPVVIFGTAAPGATVVLWHRINPAPRFTRIQQTTADAAGRYEFTRADGVVITNRNWYVVAGGKRSFTTVHEHVSALVTIAGPDGQSLLTGTPYTFSGTVSPTHTGQRVLLQRQDAGGNGNRWRTIDRARIGAGGAYAIVHRFTSPGDANLRVLLRADTRNIASASVEVSDTISEGQNPQLTLTSSADPIAEGATTDLGGKLADTTAATPVTLFAHVRGRNWSPAATGQTDAGGNYLFAGVKPVSNTFYQVRGGGRTSATLFEGVKDVVTATVSATSVAAGDSVTFSGTVSPDKSGHLIVLERQDADGKGWHVVMRTKVGAGSAFSIVHRLVDPGTKVFRVRVPGGPQNQAGVSAPLPIEVAAATQPLT